MRNKNLAMLPEALCQEREVPQTDGIVGIMRCIIALALFDSQHMKESSFQSLQHEAGVKK
jgi:hypothetical protein